MNSLGQEDTWNSITKKFIIGDKTGYLVLVLDDAGSLIKLHLDIDREGSTVGGWADQWARLFTLALENDVPLSEIIRKTIGASFAPDGFCDLGGFAKSIPDYIVRYLQGKFLEKGTK